MIKAIRKTSLIDYPGAVSSVIFTGGCNFDCRYCYNVDLIHNIEKMNTIPNEYAIELLVSRKKYIDHVVISGGEPTIHADTVELIKALKEVGFKIKLDTNASCARFLEIIPFIDYVAIDFKAPLDCYETIANADVNVSILKENFKAAKTIEHEFRSVVWDGHPLLERVHHIFEIIGSSAYWIQNVKYTKDFMPLSNEQMKSFVDRLIECGVNVKSRSQF